MPSKLGSRNLIRSSSGGWVANNEDSDGTAEPKNMWLVSSASGLRIEAPWDRPPIFFSAPAIPSGFRVNWTAEASARNSLCRLTALLMSRPKKTPMYPIAYRATPRKKNARAELSFLSSSFRERAVGPYWVMRMRIWPISASRRMPWRSPTSLRSSRMSPLRTWLNSWAITPWSWSRLRWSIAPLVTPITASPGVWPAAKALIPASSSSR